MSPLPCRAIGGAVITDHGTLTLAEATALTRFYAAEAASAGGSWRATCAERARTLLAARMEATLWRRAAGWADPLDAD
jgi:hypothetical protein